MIRYRLQWWIPVGTHGVIAAHLHMTDRSQKSSIHDLFLGVDQMRSTLPLRSDLHNAFVFSCCGKNRFAFHHVHTDGFLKIHVRTRFNRGNSVKGVPVIGRSDQNNIQILFRKHLAIVPVGPRLLFGLLPLRGDLDGFGEHLGIHIANRYHLYRGNLNQSPQVALAVPSGADESYTFGF